MRVLPMIGLMILIGASALLPGRTRADNAKRCASADPDLAIGGCTALIQSGRETNDVLSAAFYNRGLAHSNKGEFDLAIQDFDEALRLNPSYADAFNNRGLAHSNKGEYDPAIQDYDQALRLNPAYAYAFNNRGNAYFRKGDDDRAIQDFDQALRVNPSYAHAFNNRGNAHSDQGEYDLAIQDFDQALRLNPTYAHAFNDRGSAYLRQGEYDLAIRDFDQALRLDPRYADAFRGRGAAHFCLGQFAAAQPDFAAALTANPGNAYSALWLYVVQSRAGQDGRTGLEQETGQIKLTAWPGQVIDLYLGRAAPTAILAAARDPHVYKDRSQRCEAYFFLAEYALLAGRRTEAQRLFLQAIDTGATPELEYTGAHEELKRLQASAAKPGR
jgi:lipoprotein NlpI